MKLKDIHFRTGQRADSYRLAELDNIASDGAMEFLFHDLIPGLAPVQIVAQSFENEHFPYTFHNTLAAVYQDEVVGFALSFPSVYHTITQEMRDFFPPDRLAHFEIFFSTRVENSYFIDALGVYPKFRNAGIGGKLISLTQEKALQEGFDTLSLIAFADNLGAIRLYENMGFSIVKKITLKSHALIPHEGGCLLMKCRIGSDVTTVKGSGPFSHGIGG